MPQGSNFLSPVNVFSHVLSPSFVWKGDRKCGLLLQTNFSVSPCYGGCIFLCIASVMLRGQVCVSG